MSSLDRLKIRGWVLAVYLLYSITGISTFVYPSPVFQEATRNPILLYVWSLMMLSGGLLSLISVVKGGYLLELVGLSLLTTATVAYAASLLFRGGCTPTPYAGMYVLITALLLINRLSDVLRLLRAARLSAA